MKTEDTRIQSERDDRTPPTRHQRKTQDILNFCVCNRYVFRPEFSTSVLGKFQILD